MLLVGAPDECVCMSVDSRSASVYEGKGARAVLFLIVDGRTAMLIWERAIVQVDHSAFASGEIVQGLVREMEDQFAARFSAWPLPFFVLFRSPLVDYLRLLARRAARQLGATRRRRSSGSARRRSTRRTISARSGQGLPSGWPCPRSWTGYIAVRGHSMAALVFFLLRRNSRGTPLSAFVILQVFSLRRARRSRGRRCCSTTPCSASPPSFRFSSGSTCLCGAGRGSTMCLYSVRAFAVGCVVWVSEACVGG